MVMGDGGLLKDDEVHMKIRFMEGRVWSGNH